MTTPTESAVEAAALDWLFGVGWEWPAGRTLPGRAERGVGRHTR